VSIFEFDELDYFKLTIDKDIEKETIEKRFEILSGSAPEKVDDVSFGTELIKLGFRKYSLKEDSLNSQIKESLKLIAPDRSKIVTSCLPIYRDILILKTDNKITGIAKICFECGQFHFIGNGAKNEKLEEAVHFGKLWNSLKSIEATKN
jgi:hypothetical protein